MKKILLTGRPRSGKTTLIQDQLTKFPLPLGGFAVQRLTWKGETWAFRLLDLSQEAYASHWETTQEPEDIAICMASLGKWQGIAPVFDSKGRRALESCWGRKVLVVMDELGIFERNAAAFQSSVLETLDRDLPVLGVLKDKANPFLDKVRQHPAVTLLRYPGAGVEAAVGEFLREVREYVEKEHCP